MATLDSELTDDPSSELSARRTGMSFQRTRLSADRTLMAVIRTSLTLVTIGFALSQLLDTLPEGRVGKIADAHAIGLALVGSGVVILIAGIAYHLMSMAGLRELRSRLAAEGLIHGKSAYPVSFTLITAVALLLVGIAATAGMAFEIGPLG